MTDRIGIQNLSLEIIDDIDLACVMATKVDFYGINLDDPANGENCVELEIGWSNDTSTHLSIDLDAAQMLISRPTQALLDVAPNRATICLADLTAVRFDSTAATIAVDHVSGTPAGSGFPEWQVDDRRDHVYGDFSCRDVSECRRCTATRETPA
jgi:hypothetical protein